MIHLYLRNRKLAVMLSAVLFLSILPSIGCGPKTAHDFKVDLNLAARTLNTAAKENRLLYQQRVFGDKALEVRQKVARVVHAANEAVISALDIAKLMNEQTFSGDKVQILALLRDAAQALAQGQIGNARIDVILQAAAATINTAIGLVQALSHADLQFPQHMKVIRKELEKVSKQFEPVREFTLADMGGY